MSTSNCLMTAVVIVEQIPANSELLFHDSLWQFTCRDRMAIIVEAASQRLGGIPPAAENHFNSPHNG